MALDASHYVTVVSFVPIPRHLLPLSRSLLHHPPRLPPSVPLRDRHPCPIAQRNQAHTLRRLHRTARSNSHLYLKHLHPLMCPRTAPQHPLQRASHWLMTLRQDMSRRRPPRQTLYWSRYLKCHRHCYQSHCHPCQHHHAHAVNVGHRNGLNLRQAHGFKVESVNLR